MELDIEEIPEIVRQGRITISVIGCGWMGLAIACLFAEAGAKVIAVDTNEYVVSSINEGRSHLQEPEFDELVHRNVQSRKLCATSNTTEAVSRSDISIIIVPTTINKAKRSDYSSVFKACEVMGKGLRRKSLVILESTIAPLQIRKVVEALEMASHLQSGEDFGFVYSPIRAAAGTILRDIVSYPRLISGRDRASLKVARAVLGMIVKGEFVEMSSMQAAAAAKLFENIYRDINIAISSELAIFCEKAGLDFEEIRKASNTIPTHCRLLKAGPGVGGHCIPVNPYFLIDDAAQLGADLEITEAARRINDHMPLHVASLVKEGLNHLGKVADHCKVALLGVTYKADAKEDRFSPSYDIQKALSEEKIDVRVYDPLYSSKELRDMGFIGTNSVQEVLENADCVIVAVAHDYFKRIDFRDMLAMMRKPVLIVDCWGIVDREVASFPDVSLKIIGMGDSRS